MARYSFTSCLYNPDTTGFLKKITKGIHSFKAYEKINEDYLRIFKWVVYVYDRQSPLVKEIPEPMVRKGEGAILAGFTTDEDGKFDEEVEEFMFGKDDEINGLIVAYISRFADPHYIMLVASWNLLLDGTRKLLSGKYDKGMYTTTKDITKDIEDLTRTVFSSGDKDESIEMKKALYSRVENDRLKLNQENIVKYIDEHGELPKKFSPYGEGYKADKLKFVGDGQTKEV